MTKTVLAGGASFNAGNGHRLVKCPSGAVFAVAPLRVKHEMMLHQSSHRPERFQKVMDEIFRELVELVEPGPYGAYEGGPGWPDLLSVDGGTIAEALSGRSAVEVSSERLGTVFCPACGEPYEPICHCGAPEGPAHIGASHTFAPLPCPHCGYVR